MKRSYLTLSIIALIVLATGSWLFFGKKKEAAPAFKTAAVERGDVKISVTATGTLSADTTVQVGTQVSGIISKIFVDFNSVVRKGQVVAMLDTTYLAAAVEDAASSLYRNQVQLNLTKRNYDRTKELFDEKVVAQAEFDQSLSEYETAQANVRSARSNLERAKINLRYATIVAPVSGVVISRSVDRGQTVAASFNTPTLFTIANDLTKMQVQASVDEADIGKIKVGQEVDFTVDAYSDRSFNGTVRQVRLQPTVVQNVVNYTVIIDVPNPDLALMPGMTANITVKIKEANDVLKVPSAALRFFPSDEYLDKAMKAAPDSIKQILQKIKEFREKRLKGGTGNRMAQTAQNTSQPAVKQPDQSSVPSQTKGNRSESRKTSGRGVKRGNSAGPGKEITAAPVALPQQEEERMYPGMIWVKQGENLVPYRIMTGLTDGSYTQIEGKFPENAEVVTGMVTAQGQASQQQQQQQSPFSPPRMPGRGGR